MAMWRRGGGHTMSSSSTWPVIVLRRIPMRWCITYDGLTMYATYSLNAVVDAKAPKPLGSGT